MTHDEICAVIQAHKEGKPIEFMSTHNGWIKHFTPLPCLLHDISKGDIYRIKPTPKLRPWKPEEVPVGAILRVKGETGYASMILAVTPDYLFGVDWKYSAEEVFVSHQHSLDGGKTWQPCGVEESHHHSRQS